MCLANGKYKHNICNLLYEFSDKVLKQSQGYIDLDTSPHISMTANRETNQKGLVRSQAASVF